MPETAQSPIRLGVIGCGIIAQRHLSASSHCSDASFTAASSRRSAALEAIADEHAIPHRFGDWRELVSSPEVDAVVICLPDGLHAEVTCEAARRGKHVLVEKPMANSLDQAEAMVEASDANGITLMVAQVVRQIPSYQHARRLTQDGAIGSVRECTQRRLFHRDSQAQIEKLPWMRDRALCTDPLLFGFGSHEFDALLWLLGDDARTVHARGVRHRTWSAWESIDASVAMGGGYSAEVLLSLDADATAGDTVLVGTEGEIRIYLDKVVVNGVETPCPCTHDEVFGAQLAEFASCIRSGEEPGPSGRRVLPAMALLDGVLESLSSDAVVPLV
jgi:UDP-N-acetyl-2-amino-2-deoxyglucuronate dehydrogenase